MPKRGRPFQKYLDLVKILDDDKVYTAYLIADEAEKTGIYEGMSIDERESVRQKIRNMFARTAKRNNFPVEGDGIVRTYGRQPTVGWFGTRWKALFFQNARAR